MNSMSPNTIERILESGDAARSVALAIVCENRDDTSHGRVRVGYPWHVIPHHCHWGRLATSMGGKSRGLYMLPKLGDEVLVAFERGDVRFPTFSVGCGMARERRHRRTSTAATAFACCKWE